MNTIIYHRADDDGKLSREIVLQYLNHQEVNVIGWDYGDPFPEVPTEGDIWMVDISVHEILQDQKLWPRIIWIDHHKTAIEQYCRPEIRGLRFDGIGACRLCWLFTQSIGNRHNPEVGQGKPFDGEPPGVFLVGLRDVWRHVGTEYELDANRLRLALLAYPWHRYLVYSQMGNATPLGQLLEKGEAIRIYDRALMAEYAEAHHIVTFAGLRFLTLNTPGRGSGCLDAQSAEHLAKMVNGKPDHDAMMVWRYDGTNCRISLYHAAHRKDLDLSPIARGLGGGGHRGACGCRVSLEMMVKILTP